MEVWNRKIFDFVALAIVNSRENIQFFGRESFFSRKKKSSKTNYNKYVFISTFSVKLIFYPSTPWTDRERGKTSKTESSEVRQILIQRIWQLPEHSFM